MNKNNLAFSDLANRLSNQLGEDLDLTGILFLVWLQELGTRPEELSKEQKLDVLHIAICKLLEQYGYYTFIGRDADGWPHWEATKEVPTMQPKEQLQLIRSAITNYFKENNV